MRRQPLQSSIWRPYPYLYILMVLCAVMTGANAYLLHINKTLRISTVATSRSVALPIGKEVKLISGIDVDGSPMNIDTSKGRKMSFISVGSTFLAAAMIFQLVAFTTSAKAVIVAPLPPGGGDCLSNACNNSSQCTAYPGYTCSCVGVTSPNGTGSNPGGQGTCQ